MDLYHNGPQQCKKKISMIDLVIRIEFTRVILMPRFSNFVRNYTIYFHMFLYLLTSFLRVTVSFLWRSQAVSKIHVTIYPFLTSELKRNCSSLWPAQQQNRDSQQAYVTKYKNIRKFMIEFFQKFESRDDKIAWVNSIHIKKSINLLKFFTVLGQLWYWHF